jgi:RimJ/RimL family protein N-acetyltransferase
MQIEPVTLAGRHVRLEPLTLAHVDPLLEIGLDEELWRWTGTQVRTRGDMQAYVEEALDAQTQGIAVPFATVDLASTGVVGSSRFANVDRVHRRAEIGWTWVAAPWQRTAVNTEAKYLMFRHAFEVWGCIRVELKTDALNSRSRAAILRIGAKEEGTFRNHMIVHGGRIRDTVYFSLLDREWPEVKRQLEERLSRDGPIPGRRA